MFAKVFKSLYYGSLKGMKNPREVFICLLTHADRVGVVEYVTEETIAVLVGITVEEVQEAIAVLESPDPRSTTAVEDGRRLRRLIPNGWEIVNYVKYRDMRDEETRREQNKASQRVFRQGVAARKPGVSQESATNKRLSSHAEVDVEVDAEAKDSGDAPPARAPDGSVKRIQFARLKTNLTDETVAIYEFEIERWAGQFPAVDVKCEVRKMQAWLDANPARRKTARGVRRFIVGWLSKEQDKGRTAIPIKVPERSMEAQRASEEMDPLRVAQRQRIEWEREQAKGVG